MDFSKSLGTFKNQNCSILLQSNCDLTCFYIYRTERSLQSSYNYHFQRRVYSVTRSPVFNTHSFLWIHVGLAALSVLALCSMDVDEEH